MIRTPFITALYVAFFLFLSWRCNDKDVPSQEYPGIETKPVTEISRSGAVFHAEVRSTGRRSIKDHGFIWSLNPNTPESASEKISLGVLNDAGSFQARIQCTFMQDTTYYVKAFAATEDHMVYGGIVNFRSVRRLPPVIDDFTPRSGRWGDTVQIEGKYFSKLTKEIEVTFGAFESKIIANSDSTIECIVPSHIPERSVPVNVTVAGQETTASHEFQFVSPVLDSFSPATGTFGDIITISGSNFSPIKSENKVQFSEFFAEVVASSPTSISALVPAGLLYKDNQITVTVNLQAVQSSEIFVMKAPVIKAFSPRTGTRETVVTIEGSNFAPIKRGNTVRFGGNEARILSVSVTELRVAVPGGSYDSREADVSVTVAEQTTTAVETFSLNDPWLEKENIAGLKIDYATAFAIGDKGYVGLGTQGSQSLWQYTPEHNSWSEVAPFPGKGRDHATSFVIDGLAYVGGGGRVNLLSDFWRYDPSSDSWAAVADFPFGIKDAIGLSLNGKGYVAATNPGEETSGLWEYDPHANEWSKLSANTDHGHLIDGGFVTDNSLFFVANNPAGNRNVLMEFDLGGSGWIIRDNDALGLEEEVTCFALGGKGYLFDENVLHEYDAGDGSWKTIGAAPSGRQSAIAFVIGNKAYFGFGHRGKTRINDFWEWSPL